MDKGKRLFLAQQAARAVQLFAGKLVLAETESMEIADLYEPWGPGKRYPAGKILRSGTNQDGETQLYSVIAEHVSQEGWEPGAAPSLFKRIGFDASGAPIWTQPLGAYDAYMKGDAVSHKGGLWVSGIDGNVWEPGVYGWTAEGGGAG